MAIIPGKPSSDAQMLITVAICTLNHAESLRGTLESLAAMRLPDDLDWEVVVVNNGCTDHTDEIIRTADRLPIRREFEPQRGLSRARNRAVDAAKGDYIVWTDDDVIVDPGWLAAYADAFRRWPEAAVFGGKILERFAIPVPKWLAGNEAFKGFTARDFGDEVLPLSIPKRRLPFGPNFSTRAAEQRAFRYNPELGHAPGQWRRGEETDVIERVLQSGATGYWVPQALVEHCDTHEQQTLRYFAGFFATFGEAEAVRSDSLVAPGPVWFNAPRWMWRRLIDQGMRFCIHRPISPASVWLPHLRECAIIWGKLRYWRSQATRSRC
jgi:glycosyltransferase involved in cell wall biosynthesis